MEGGAISCDDTALGVVSIVLRRDLFEGAVDWVLSTIDSGDETSPLLPFPTVDWRDVVAEDVGVGEPRTLEEVCLSVGSRKDSTGEGSACMTPRRSLLVRIAAAWIMAT